MTATDDRTTNVLLSGVGGQGVILASYLLTRIAINDGYDVKQSEVHGMSQRGGSVISHLRFGTTVHSPLISPGAADILISLEALEALRYLPQLKPEGTLVYNSISINPSTVAAGLATYPPDLQERIEKAHGRSFGVDARRLAQEAGNVRSENVVLLGAVSGSLPFSQDAWYDVIKEVVPPHTVDVNIKAFELGRAETANQVREEAK